MSRWLTQFRLALRSVFLRKRVDQELDEELQYHLERQIREGLNTGLTPEEARYAASRAMGGIAKSKEECRDTRGVNFIHDLLRDLQYAGRNLRRSPGFAALAILIMAVGIGANTAVFSVVNAVLLKPLPYRDPGRIVTLSNVVRAPAGANALAKLISVPDFQDWHDQSTVFDAMAYYGTRRVSVTVGTSAEYARLTRVTREFFRVFDVQPVAGRSFTADEEKVGAGAVLVSSAYARQHFVEPSHALGQVLRVFDRPVTIVGVLPQAFDFPDGTEIWFPATALASPSVTQRTANNRLAIGRLKRDITLPAASAEMTSIARRLEQAYPQSNSGKGVALTPLLDDTVGDTGAMLYLLLGAVGLVLLIACANVATLLLAKATGRAHEMAIRAALGASRSRIVRQLLVEGLVLAIIAGVAGLVVAVWGTRALVAIAPAGVPRLAQAGVDGTVLTFTLCVCTMVSVLFALPPALQVSQVDTNDSLQASAGRTVVGGRGRTLRDALVVGEIAVTVVLLTGGGLLVRSLLALQQVSLGFRPEHVLAMETTPQNRQRSRALFTGLLSDVSVLPGVVAVGAINAPPGNVDSTSTYWIDHLPKELNLLTGPSTVMSVVAPGTFNALGIPLRRGRDFREGDTADAPRAAIINESLARQAFRHDDPLGHVIFCAFDSLEPMTIVGVVGDVRQYGPAVEASPECYLPYLQHGFNNETLSIVVRTSGDPGLLADTVRQKAHGRSPDVSVKATTMEVLVGEHFAAPRFRAILVALFGAVALSLALAGIYGVMAYTVAQRSREIGLRMALGATAQNVVWMMLRRGIQIVAVGLLIGLVGAAASARLLRTMLFQVRPNDPLVYLAVAVLLGLVALVASYVPARRASKIDPLVALRQE
jgi:putative ABC transport system permease protein